MANINMNLTTLCNLRKRQQLFPMPSFRANPISPYPQYTQEQLDMRRKVEILKYSNNASSTKTNNITKKGRFAQVITGKYQSKSYTTTYTDVVSTVFDPVTNTDRVVITRVPVLAPYDCSLDNLIPTPTSGSGVPGPITNLYYDPSVPLYNYSNSADRIYAITDAPDTDLWKVNYVSENTAAFYTIKSVNAGTLQTNPTDTTLLSFYITQNISSRHYIYELNVPIAIYFFGKYKGTSPTSFANITLSIPSSGINPQVVFVNNTLSTNRIVSFTADTQNVSSITFDISGNNTGKDFSGSLYAGILKITNMDLYTEPGYIYDINIITSMLFTYTNIDNFITNYDFTYGIYYNYNNSNKKIQNNCTIITTESVKPLIPIQLTGVSGG